MSIEIIAMVCGMYSADGDGMVNDFHRTHYRSRAIGQVRLIIVEATAVVANGIISNRDLGMAYENKINIKYPEQ